MKVKLTLKLDKTLFQKAKEYAKSKNESLSSLVEKYLIELTSNDNFKQTLSPKVKKLSGILKDKNINYKDEVSSYLNGKYYKSI